MNFWKRAASGLLAGILILSTGCSGKNLTWVYEKDGVQAPAGLYQIYLISSANAARAKLVEANQDNAGYTAPAYKDLLDGEEVEGVAAAHWITQEAQRQMREYFAVEEQFHSLGLTLTEANQKTAVSSAATTWQQEYDPKLSYGAFYEQNGVAQTSLVLYVETMLKREALFQAIYGPGGTSEVSQQELMDAFLADYAKVDMLVFYKAGADQMGADGTLTDIVTQDAATKARAEGFLTRLAAGEAVEDLAYEQEKQDAGDAASSIEKPMPGSRMVLLDRTMAGSYYYSQELVNGALTAPLDKPVLLEDDTFFYVIQRKDLADDTAVFEASKEQVLANLKAGELEQSLKDWGNTMELTANYEAVEKYTPARLKLAW